MSYVDTSLGFYQAPMAPAGTVPRGAVEFSNSPMINGQLRNAGINIYPNALGSAGGLGSQQSTTGSEKAVVPIDVPLDISSFITAHEILFSYPIEDSPLVGRSVNNPGVGITTLSMLNMMLRKDWEDIVHLSRQTGDDELIEFAKNYMAYGESWFTMGGRSDVHGWANVAKVMMDDRFKMFRLASSYGLRRLNFMGIVETGREVNARLPLGQVSSQLAGLVMARNYWGAGASPGHCVGLVIRKESQSGPYQVVPWSSIERSSIGSSLLTYVDCAGNYRDSRVLNIGRCALPTVGSYSSSANKAVLGLTGEIESLTELSARISQMETIPGLALFTSARNFY